MPANLTNCGEFHGLPEVIDRAIEAIGGNRSELARQLDDMPEGTLRRMQNGETSWRIHELAHLAPFMPPAMRRDLAETVARLLGFRVSLLPLVPLVRGATPDAAVGHSIGVVHQASRLLEMVHRFGRDGIDAEESRAIDEQVDEVKRAGETVAAASATCAGRRS
jgi:hypothetical protein